MKCLGWIFLASAAFLHQFMGCYSQDCGHTNWKYSHSVDLCYHMIHTSTPLQWSVAEESCVKLGGHLACPWNEVQNDAVEWFIRRAGARYENVWIGLSHPLGHAHYNYTAQRRTGWEWVDGSPYNYTGRGSTAWEGWAQDEPGAYETWARLYDGEWKGIGTDSSQFHYAVCQKNAVKITSTTTLSSLPTTVLSTSSTTETTQSSTVPTQPPTTTMPTTTLPTTTQTSTVKPTTTTTLSSTTPPTTTTQYTSPTPTSTTTVLSSSTTTESTSTSSPTTITTSTTVVTSTTTSTALPKSTTSEPSSSSSSTLKSTKQQTTLSTMSSTGLPSTSQSNATLGASPATHHSLSSVIVIPVSVMLSLAALILAVLSLVVYIIRTRKKAEDKKELVKNEGGPEKYDIEMRKFNDAEFEDDVFMNPKSRKDKILVAFRNFIRSKDKPFLYQSDEKPTAQVKPMSKQSTQLKLSEIEFFLNRYDFKNLIRSQFQSLPMSALSSSEDNPIGAADVDSFYRKNTFIVATETPKTASKDIWDLVWNRSVEHMIIFGNPDTNNDKLKEQTSEQMQIHLEDKKVGDCSVTKILRLQKSNESRTVVQYHFQFKFDPGSDSYRKSLLNFRVLLRKICISGAPPVFINDSQGKGMAGTFLAIDSLLDEVTQYNAIDVVKCLTRLREQIPAAESVDHLELIYRVISEDLQVKDTCVHIDMDEDCSTA